VFRHGRIRHLPPSCRFGGGPVHHDPVDGIWAKPGNREWARRPLSFFVVCPYPIHRHSRVMVNWDPPISQVIHLPGAIQNYITSIGSNTKTNTAVIWIHSNSASALSSCICTRVSCCSRKFVWVTLDPGPPPERSLQKTKQKASTVYCEYDSCCSCTGSLRL
jgi:hypothetical protein